MWGHEWDYVWDSGQDIVLVMIGAMCGTGNWIMSGSRCGPVGWVMCGVM